MTDHLNNNKNKSWLLPIEWFLTICPLTGDYFGYKTVVPYRFVGCTSSSNLYWKFQGGCFDLSDNMPSLLDLRFADDILLFARTAAEAMALLNDFVRKLQNIGLRLIAAKTVVLTSEVQPPASLHTNNGVKLRVETRRGTQMAWLHDQCCRIKEHASLDLQHQLHAASRVCHANSANKLILCDKGVSILHRLRYFEKIISPVACFGASHRAIHKDDLAKLDVEYHRLMRMVVGPPADTNWASPWHDILHGWNNKAQMLSTTLDWNLGLSHA